MEALRNRKFQLNDHLSYDMRLLRKVYVVMYVSNKKQTVDSECKENKIKDKEGTNNKEKSPVKTV